MYRKKSDHEKKTSRSTKCQFVFLTQQCEKYLGSINQLEDVLFTVCAVAIIAT